MIVLSRFDDWSVNKYKKFKNVGTIGPKIMQLCQKIEPAATEQLTFRILIAIYFKKKKRGLLLVYFLKAAPPLFSSIFTKIDVSDSS
jgi:hypothetical protein